ncbi:MAG: glycosyl hydrolase, partial [bacterium]
MRSFINLITAILLLILSSCTPNKENDATDDKLFEGFIAPPAEARPFVRWWWNGNHITADEIIRQLDVLKDAGIGGIEINPIAMPEEAKDIGTSPLVWLSSEWNEMLVLAAEEAKKRGMISDLIVGSGWPFGGEFVQEDETIQRIMSHKLPVSGGEIISEDKESLYEKLRGSLDMRV